jgi:hypothetical protein
LSQISAFETPFIRDIAPFSVPVFSCFEQKDRPPSIPESRRSSAFYRCFYSSTSSRLIPANALSPDALNLSRREMNKGQLAEMLHVTRPTLERIIREHLSAKNPENS